MRRKADDQIGNRIADPAQEAIIRAPVTARLIVESGPGCGKTFVACARVAQLVQDGVSGNRIVVLSFTRTAVREIRQRIGALAINAGAVAEVDVRTLDSFAGYLRTSAALRADAPPPGNYDEGVRKTVELFRVGNTVVRETVERYRHVLIDEAQDLVGERASLVRALLDALPKKCGWTVFLDPAQAIFDWAETRARDLARAASFVEHANDLEAQVGVERLNLETIHRTKEPELLTLMQRARRVVLAGGSQATPEVRRLALEQDPSETPLTEESFAGLVKSVDPTTLFLFRTRAEALEASRWLSKNKIEHRLRFGELPYAIAPWVSAVINTSGLGDLREAQFAQAWQSVLSEYPKLLTGWEPESAWQVLKRLGWQPAAKLVSVQTVAAKLNQAGLPDDLVRKEVGTSGPIVGTIHGSKGREAPIVYACLRETEEQSDSRLDQIEESRVIYVALTRAQTRCRVRRTEGVAFRWTSQGRPWRYDDAGFRIRFECGRAGDVDAFGAIAASGNPAKQQQALTAWTGVPLALRAIKNADGGLEQREWRHVLVRVVGEKDEAPDSALASFSQSWTADVHRQIFKEAGWGKTPTKVYELQLIDLATVGAATDDPRLHSLPEPWRTTRMWLAPIVTSWARAYRETKRR